MQLKEIVQKAQGFINEARSRLNEGNEKRCRTRMEVLTGFLMMEIADLAPDEIDLPTEEPEQPEV